MELWSGRHVFLCGHSTCVYPFLREALSLSLDSYGLPSRRGNGRNTLLFFCGQAVQGCAQVF